MATKQSFLDRIQKQRLEIREEEMEEMEGMSQDMRTRMNEATTNIKKNAVLSSYKRFQEEGNDKDTSLLKATIANESSAKAQGNTTYNKQLTQATVSATGAKENYQGQAQKLKEQQVKMQERWDNDVKSTIDTLSSEMVNPQYMEFLGAMGLSPKSIFALQRGKNNYIASFKDQVRKNYNNDIMYFQQEKEITTAAKQDYEQKAAFLLGERDRIVKEKEQKQAGARDANFNALSIIKGFSAEQTVGMGTAGLQNIVNSIGGTIDNNTLGGFVSAAQSEVDAKDEDKGYIETQRGIDIDSQMLELEKKRKEIGGFRTDRHNNPTAFTTEIAKQAGLVEGVDYTKGDPFPENPNIFTAQLIGDPVDQTIKVIDDIGFFTSTGQQRWTHTAIDKDIWDGMNKTDKTAIVKDMYKNEGGSGKLFGEAPTVVLTQEEKIKQEDSLRKEAVNISSSGRNIKGFSDRIDIGIANFKKVQAEGGDLSAASVAIVTSYNKMLDEGSVVRESEYARTSEGQSLINTLQGKVEKIQQGGAGITLDVLEEAQDISKKILLKVQEDLVDQLVPIDKSIKQRGLNKYLVLSPSLIDLLEDKGKLKFDFSTMDDKQFIDFGTKELTNSEYYGSEQ